MRVSLAMVAAISFLPIKALPLEDTAAPLPLDNLATSSSPANFTITLPSSNLTIRSSLDAQESAREAERKALHDCHLRYKYMDWETIACHNKVWFRMGTAWTEPGHCWAACYERIEEAIRLDRPKKQCFLWVKMASCRTGYRMLGEDEYIPPVERPKQPVPR
ncbi:hypothetical protein BX600DRAFT_547541 [Xylariales sp. PMI_506]|nr:hypothetical protein BX600DRAFT_547541 [Xylariales sp. PMI_506]